MKILFGGDVVGSMGCEFAAQSVRRIKNERGIDVVIINGENSADGNGLTRGSMEALFSFADVITTGNHCFRRQEAIDLYDEHSFLLRPANYPEGTAGTGVCIIDKGAYSLAVMNICGTAFMDALDNPFECADRLIAQCGTKNIIVDFHAEATSEKKAMGFYLDGRVSAVIGTHTHVQTADEMILPKGTAYITDAGMCGTELSVLGVEPELAVRKQCYRMPVRFTEAKGAQFFCGVIAEINEKTGTAVSVERIQLKESR